MRGLVGFFVAAVCWAQTGADLEAVIETDAGTFRIEFAPDKAPKHVEHFIKLAREGYYDGGAFHRTIAYGIIQGGDPLLKDAKTPRKLWGTGGLSQLASEFSDLKHERGTVSSVSIPDKKDSEGAQFFICMGPQPALDGKYTIFGRVNEGIEVVDKISQSKLAEDGMVEKPVRILKVSIEKKKVQPFVNAPVEELRKTVVMKTTLGTLKLKMEPDWAPNHVRNFLMLVETGWYNGTGFHRVVKDFVIQGGMANTRAGGGGHPADKWIHPLKGEFRKDVKHERGILSMARTDDPDSATTSFFVMLGSATNLDGAYSAFGRVVEGMEVLEAFEKEPLDGETPKRRLEVIEAHIE